MNKKTKSYIDLALFNGFVTGFVACSAIISFVDGDVSMGIMLTVLMVLNAMFMITNRSRGRE